MMPTLTWLGCSGWSITFISGTMTRLSRSAWAPSIGLALAVGDLGAVVVSRDDGDAEPPPPLVVVTPAHPTTSPTSARPRPSPWALLRILLPRIGRPPRYAMDSRKSSPQPSPASSLSAPSPKKSM